MTWTKINTYGLQDRFQERTVQEVFKFNQLDSDYNNYNQSLWIQNERDELNNHLIKSFNEIYEWVGYYPRPIWKTIKVPLDDYKFYTDEFLQVPESAFLNEFGVRDVELIEADVSYVLDANTPTYNVTFEVTIDEITDGEIALFHKSVDAFNNVADDRFRVYPTQVYYDGSKYIFTIPYARLLKPILQNTLYEGGDQNVRQSYSPTNTNNFVDGLDCYRVFNNSEVKAKVIGYPFDYSGSTVLQEKEVGAVILDGYDSKFKLVENSSSPTFNYTEVEIYCNIGKPLNMNNNMDSTLEELIIRRAKVEMGINARLAAAKISTQWDFDELPSYAKSNPDGGMIGVGFQPNPIGSKNIDIITFQSLLPIANWRGKINDMRFWIR